MSANPPANVLVARLPAQSGAPRDQRLSNQGQIPTAGWKEEATGVSALIMQSGRDREGSAEVGTTAANGTDQKRHRSEAVN